MTAIAEKNGTLTGADGVNIFYRHYAAQSERARLVIAHGLGEHAGRYRNVVDRLLPEGISIWAPDHRGHGRSDGKRGHVEHFSQYVADLRLTIELARRDRPPDTPCFLLGHSLGGLIAIVFAEAHPDLIDGVVASSPALGMVAEIPLVKKIMGSLMSRFRPELSMGNELNAALISHDPKVVAAYKADPLVHDRVSARFFTELLAAMESAKARAASLAVPILLQVAGEDHLVSAQTSVRFFQKLSIQDKTLHVYEGLYHEIYNEVDDRRNEVFEDLENWLEGRI